MAIIKSVKKIHAFFVYNTFFVFLWCEIELKYSDFMQSVTFNCVKNAEQLKKAFKQMKVLKYVFLFFFIPLTCGIEVLMIYALLPELLNSPLNEETLEMWFWGILVIIVMLVLIIFLCVFLSQFDECNCMMFDIIADKTFGWDEERKQFFYSDKYRTLRFNGDDVKKWVSMSNKGNTTTDIIQLINGDQFVIESMFNPDVHTFLFENRENLNLPRPKFITFVINYYKNPI